MAWYKIYTTEMVKFRLESFVALQKYEKRFKKKKVLGAIPQTQTFIKNLGLETFKEDKQQSKYTQTEKLVMCVRVKHMCAVSACLHVHLCVINSPLCL